MKRKNNSYISTLEPYPKKHRIDINNYFENINHIFKKIKLEHNKNCTFNLIIDHNNNIKPQIFIDNDYINPYILDIY